MDKQLNTKSQVKALQLQSDYLRTLLDRVIRKLTNLEQGLETTGSPTSAVLAAELNEVATLSARLAAEAARLPGFVQSVTPDPPESHER